MPINSFLMRDTPYWLNFIFAGQGFNVFDRRSVGSGSSIYIQVNVGEFPDNRLLHMLHREHAFFNGGPFIVDLIEAPTLTSGTTQIMAHNLDRRSSKMADTLFYSNPTNVSGGTVIQSDFIAGQGVGSNLAGFVVPVLLERVFKPNTIYVFRITNQGGQTGTFQTSLNFYESGN